MIESDTELQINEEEAKIKVKSRGKKRKRIASESSTDEDVLPENTLEFEKSLHATAIKNNLDDVSVKKILKKVVTNDHVLALVKLREEEEEDSGTEENLRPKLTRAKAKELMKVSPKSAPWNLELTPIKHIPVKTRPEVKALIAQELPEDEDDDEYEPAHDDVPSDDDHILESSSDVDSLPRTPVTPRSQGKITPKVVTDGPFKVPQELSTQAKRKLVLEEEATIALRTRSKLSLSATSIEHIESSFVPPDDLPMPDVDSLWNDFLKDCLDPVSSAKNEDDDEADPEYNVAADPDANEEDEESLENSIIKISKKELNDLVTELFSIIPDDTAENLANNMAQDVLVENGGLQTEMPTRWEGKQEPESDGENSAAMPRPAPVATMGERFSIGKCEPEEQNDEQLNNQEKPLTESQPGQLPMGTNAPAPPAAKISVTSKQKLVAKQPPNLLREILGVNTLNPIRVEIQKDACTMLPEQRLLLQQQLRQHIQLAAGCYLQLFVHPTHWARAPVYKDYLVSFDKMLMNNPSSVVNVCNLKPALDLMASWEAAVSSSTKENLEMIEFVQKEIERSRKRRGHNSLYLGNFPELFLQVVSNSTVFLYPYLLPSMPFRPDVDGRRFSYVKSEDKLIALGLDQFWKYVFANPEIFKPPAHIHPRHRWGLAATAQLVCKYMMPWMPVKTLLAHVRHAKKGLDKDNPIYKFFESDSVEPMKHRLLQFNPQLTLYEQPEHEIPRTWIRYLAKSSNRFKKYLYRPRQPECPAPDGVDMEVNVQAPNKKALPIHFNKKINCNRLNLLPKNDEATPEDRIDIPINTTTSSQPMVASNIYTVLSTSSGSFLVPLQMQTYTVNSTTTPISTAEETGKNDSNNVQVDNLEATETAVDSIPAHQEDTESDINSDHCSCCIQMRKIFRKRPKTIVDYFKSSENITINCQCKGRKYPRITNRLKLLLSSYRLHSKCVFDELQNKLQNYKSEIECKECPSNDSVICDDEENDLITAALFHLKTTSLTVTVRNNMTKKRIHTLFSNFNIDSGDVVTLTENLYKFCEEELVGLYKEFTGFLTAEQADKVGYFKDYFIQHCMEKLVKKIEELVTKKEKQHQILKFLKTKFFTSAMQQWTACDICTALLHMMHGYPTLAQYVFSLFPHMYAHSNQDQVQQPSSDSCSEPAVTEASAEVDVNAIEATDDTAEVAHKTAKVANENADVVNKTTEVANENAKVDNENAEVSNKTAEVTNGNAKVANETAEVANETVKVDNENAEVSNKTAEVTNGNAKVANETAEVANETAKVDNENAEVSNKTAEVTNGNAKVANENAEVPNENAKVANEIAEVANETSDITNKTAEVANENSKVINENAKVANETAEDANKTVQVVSGSAETTNYPVEAATENAEDAKETAESNAIADNEADRHSSNPSSEVSEEKNCDNTIVQEALLVIEHDTSVKIKEEDLNESMETEIISPVSDMSRLIMSDDDTEIKTECPEWTREEDKVILEVLKQHIVPEERKGKTVLEVLEETQALAMIADTLSHKSINEVTERFLYLLQLLVNGDQ